MAIVEDERNQTPKRLKIEETLEDNHEELDRISALPDCLIIEILSRLPSTEDAIRTGIFSKRWKSLWTSVSTLIFKQNSETTVDNRFTFNFASLVNITLSQCRHSNLQKFQISIHYDSRFERQVNIWIRYALSRNVEQLNLTFSNPYIEYCVLDNQLFINSCLTDLQLSGFTFHPKGAITWKTLRRLHISESYLDKDLIRNILSGSPVLETLVLEACYGYSRLDITSKSVKNLVLSRYENRHCLERVEINAPNILSLKIEGFLCLLKVFLLDVSSLVETELNYRTIWHKEFNEKMLKDFIQSLRHVKKLQVGSRCSKVGTRLKAKGFVFPPNVKFPDSDSLKEDSDSDSVESEEGEVRLLDYDSIEHWCSTKCIKELILIPKMAKGTWTSRCLLG